MIAVVTEEFATHGHNMAKHLGHGDLAVLVLPYPLEARPDDELLAISAEYYPQALELLGVTAVTLTGAQVEVPADPTAFYELSLAEGWGDGAPLLPADRRRDRGAARRARPTRPTTCVGVLPPQYGVATVELVAANAAMAGVQPAAFPLVLAALEALTRPGVERVRAHHHDVERVPDADRERPVARRARHRLPRRLHGRRRRARLDDDRARGRRCACATSAASAPARRRAPCSASPPASGCASASGRSARRGRRSRSGAASPPTPTSSRCTAARARSRSPTSTTTTRATCSYLLAKSIAYPLANMYLGNADNGEVVLAVNPMWAERFGAAFPDVADLQAYLHEHAWQPLDLWPRAEPGDPARRRAGSDGATDRVYLTARPDQIVPVVCGGLGSLHAIALPSFGESADAERRRPRRCGLTVDADAVAEAVDEVGRILRADGGDLVLVDADPTTLRIRLALAPRRRELRRVRAPARPARARRSAPAIGRRVPGEFELVLADPRR